MEEAKIPAEAGGPTAENKEKLEERMSQIGHDNGHLDLLEIRELAVQQLWGDPSRQRMGGT